MLDVSEQGVDWNGSVERMEGLQSLGRLYAMRQILRDLQCRALTRGDSVLAWRVQVRLDHLDEVEDMLVLAMAGPAVGDA